MLLNKKAAAYFTPWKYKIEHLSKGDTIFIYQSGVGVVAMGRASGKLEKEAYHGDLKHKDEEYYRNFDRFQLVDPLIPAAKIKEVTGTNYRFLGTMFSLDADSAAALVAYIQKQNLV